MPEKAFYKIGDACKALDIQPYVLRYWETEFPLLKPDKSKSGQRVYSQEDMGVIQRIKELLYDEGFTIAGAKKKLEAELADGRKLHLGTADIRDAAAEPAEAEAEASAEAATPPAEKPKPAKAAAPAKKAAPKATKKPPVKTPAKATAKTAAKPPAKTAAKPAKKADTKPAPTKPKPAPKPKPAAAQPTADAETQKRIKTLEKGVRAALKEARAILSLLDAEPETKGTAKKS